jgi:hypothetical protein
LKAIRSRLLTFSTGALATALGTASGAGSDGKLYIDQAPDDVTYPYGTLRVVDRRSEGDDGGFARRLEVEIHLYHRPRNTASTLKAMADLCERALRAWVDVSSGVIVSRLGIARGSLTYEEPADRELILERLVVPFYVHETLHTQDSA